MFNDEEKNNKINQNQGDNSWQEVDEEVNPFAQNSQNQGKNHSWSGEKRTGQSGFEGQQQRQQGFWSFGSSNGQSQGFWGEGNRFQGGFGFGQSPRIVMDRARDLRRLGRESLQQRWKSATLMVFLCYILINVPKDILNMLLGSTMDVSEYLGYEEESVVVVTSVVAIAYVLLVSGPFIVGLLRHFLKGFRGEAPGNGVLFSGFSTFWKSMALYLYIWMFILLWGCVPVVGFVLAMVAAMRYSMAFFIWIDNPSLSHGEAVNQSKMLMAGNKSKFFLVNCSFIGWYLLASIPGSLLLTVAVNLTSNEWILWGLGYLVDLCLYVVMAYHLSTLVGFYEILTQRINGATYFPGRY